MSSTNKPIGTFKAPTQKRSRESLARIYAALNVLLRTKNFDQITVQELSGQSNVAVGSIYQRFGSKNQLLWTMYGAYLDKAVTRSQALLLESAGMSLEERVRAHIALVYDMFTEHKGVVRSLVLKMRQNPDAVPEAYRKQAELLFVNAAILLGKDNPESDEEQITYAISVFISTCREMLLFSKHQWATPKRLEKSEFVENLTLATLAVLNR